MKKFLIFIFITVIMLPVGAQTITGGIKYSQSLAKDELLASPSVKSNQQFIRESLVDSNYGENISMLLKGVTELKDRTLAKFSDGSYGVIYKAQPQTVLYYSQDGILTHNEEKSSLEYPYKTYKYTPNGRLVNMSLRVSEEETFIFTPDGKLIAHWLGRYCYDENNRVIMSREVLK